MSLDDFQQVCVDILKDVDTFCNEKGINYSVAYGTLIGIIRHKGFIPWDDDIDIVMPRPDYNRFVKEFNGWAGHLRVASPELDWNYYAPYANIYDIRTLLIEPRNRHNTEMGVKIDLFPIDGVPSNLNEYVEQCNRINRYKRVLAAKRRPLKYCLQDSLLNAIKVIGAKIIFSPFSYKMIQKRIHDIAISCNYEESEFVDNVVYSPYFAKRHLRSNYDIFEYKPFDNTKFMVASGYHEILSTIYGDYMKLPPENQRVTHHNFKAYWK